MSDSPSNPGNPADSAAPASATPAAADAGASAASPAPQAAAAQPSTASAPPAAPQQNRWTSLIIAVAVVTLGGFALGRMSANDQAAAPQPSVERRVPMNVSLPTSRISPAMLERMREARHNLRFPPPGSTPPPPPAALQAAPGAEPRPSPTNQTELSRMAVGQLQPQVQTCFSRSPPPHGGMVLVTASLHRDDSGGTMANAHVGRSTVDAPEAERCVVDTVAKAHFPELKGHDDMPIVLPFAYTGSK